MMTSEYFDTNLPECGFLVKVAVPLLNLMEWVDLVNVMTAQHTDSTAVSAIQTSPLQVAQPTLQTCLLYPEPRI
jgi:hypothetical protein